MPSKLDEFNNYFCSLYHCLSVSIAGRLRFDEWFYDTKI